MLQSRKKRKSLPFACTLRYHLNYLTTLFPIGPNSARCTGQPMLQLCMATNSRAAVATAPATQAHIARSTGEQTVTSTLLLFKEQQFLQDV